MGLKTLLLLGRHFEVGFFFFLCAPLNEILVNSFTNK